MKRKIKKGGFFLHKKSKNIFFSVFFAFLGLSFPLFFVDGLASTIGSYTASAITGTLFLVVSTVSLVFSTFADWFLRISLSPEFISIPYTTGNDFVSYGWSIVRDFVNMFFIIVLIIIGLSTSLQVETYRWQKTLPRLVAVALLINFTPVFLGVFIDAANMMMNYFVSSIGEESIFVMRMRGLYDVMASNLANAPWTSFTGGIITPVAMSVIFTLFNTLTGIIYGLYGILFAMRYVVIWLLVIISPFGFFCYILPATQPFFRYWWRLFIWWCIAGIAAAFFLYLGEIMFQYIDQDAMMPVSTQHQGMDIGMFVRTFPLMIPLLFILFGFISTISMSSAGAKGFVMGLQNISGAAKKSNFKFSGSNLSEKTQSAGAAVRNAFSPGPISAPSSSGASLSSSASGKGSSSSESSSLHKRKGFSGDSAEGGTSSVSGVASGSGSAGNIAGSPIEAKSFASQGTVSAAESIASELNSLDASSLVDKKGALPERDNQESKSTTRVVQKGDNEEETVYSAETGTTVVKKNAQQCSECKGYISKTATVCPLCKKKVSSKTK